MEPSILLIALEDEEDEEVVSQLDEEMEEEDASSPPPLAVPTPLTHPEEEEHQSVLVPGTPNPLQYIISEATRFSVEIKKLREQIATAQQRIQKQDEEILLKNERLAEATELISEQQSRLESFEHIMEEGGGVENLVDLRELKILVAQERKQRVKVEEKFEKLKTSFANVKGEYAQLNEEIRRNFEFLSEEASEQNGEEENVSASANQKLDQLSNHIQNKFESWASEQRILKTAVVEMNLFAGNLMGMLGSLNLKVCQTNPTTRSKPEYKQAIKSTAKVEKVEETGIPASNVNLEHCKDTSRSRQGFFCICGNEYSSRSNLSIHIRTYTEEGKFKCKICNEKFLLFYILRRHLHAKHNIKPKKGGGAHCVGCMECGKTFASQANLWQHRKLVHPRASLGNQNGSPSNVPTAQCLADDSCEEIEVLENTSVTLASSPTRNRRPPTFLSSVAMSFASSKFSSHKRAVKPTRVICEPAISVVSISGKKHGMNIARRHQGFYCICGKKFISRKRLDGHIQFQNRSQPDSPSDPMTSADGVLHGVIPSKPLQCLCGYRTNNKYNTKKHIMYYTTERKFTCNLCPKRFLNTAYLRGHYIKSHKIYKNMNLGTGCRKCGMSFNNMKEFHEHSRSVHGSSEGIPKPVHGVQTAGTSSSGFAKRGRGVRNSEPSTSGCEDYELFDNQSPATPATSENNLTKEKKFGCVICANAFTRIYDMYRHLQNVHDVDPSTFPIGCPDCDATFRTRQNLIRHRVTVHHSTIENRRQIKTEIENEPSFYDQDSTYDDFPSSPPLSPQPIPIRFGRASVMPKLEPTAPLPSPHETETEIHERDTSKRGKGFFCTCGTKFSEKKNLIVHIRQKTNKWNFQCKLCKKRFFYNSVLRKHMQSSHKILVSNNLEERTFGCVNCGSTFETVLDLRQHQKFHHNMKVGSEEQGHTDTEDIDAPTPAPPKLRRRNAVVPVHGVDTEKMEQELFYCICGKNCNNKKSLQAHITYNRKERIFSCSLCPSRFPFQSFLKQHMGRSHKVAGGEGGGAATGIDPTYNRRRSRCRKCGKNFRSKVDLLRHTKTFHKGKVTQLRNSARSRIRNFKSRNRSSQHQEIVGEQNPASGEPMYKCSCGNEYMQRSSLLKHISKQTRGRIFKCNYCSKSFIEAANLRIHARTVHQMDSYDRLQGCGICGELFENGEERIRHRIQVHNTRR